MWYRLGTISITNGTTALTGTDTYWDDNIITGDILYLDGGWWEIDSIDSDTTITLADTYTGVTKTNDTYAIVRAGAANGTLISRITEVVTKWRNRENEIVAWQGGTIDGGPNLDGRYPLTNPDGVENLVDCPAKISALDSAYLGESPTDPISGMLTGSLYFNSTDDVIRYYTGTDWQTWTGDGRTILNGTVDPTTEGLNGDFYINTNTQYIFGPKAADVWPAGIDLNGIDGAGFTGGSYDSGTGIVTFTSDDGLGFATGDLRGADGYTPVKDTDYFDGADGTNIDTVTSNKTGSTTTVTVTGTFSGSPHTFDIEDGYTPIKDIDYFDGAKGDTGLGFTGGSYEQSTGVITFTSDDGLGFTTSDLRGIDGDSITSVTSNKSGNTTTVTISGTFAGSPEIFDIEDGVDGAGAGDMLASTYDPQTISADAFSRANHTGTQAATTITDDSTHRFVTDTEKSTWNAKQDALVADTDYLTPGTAGTTYAPKLGVDDNYVTDAEKVILSNTSNINTGDQILPTALADLTEDTTHRLVTDTEKSTWNAKQDALVADTDYLTPTTASTTYEPADSDIVKAPLGVLPALDGSNLSGVSSTADVTYENLSANDDIGTGADQVSQGDHLHTGTYAPALGADDNYVTDAEKTVIGNTSGTNTGDETKASVEALSIDITKAQITDLGSYDNYVSWTIKDGDTTTYTVTSGDTLQIAAGTGITSNFTADDVLTITNSSPNVTTNITTSHSASTVTVNSSDGTNGTINAATTSLAGVMSSSDKSTIDGLGSQSSYDQTISTSAPSGGSDGDVWYQV